MRAQTLLLEARLSPPSYVVWRRALNDFDEPTVPRAYGGVYNEQHDKVATITKRRTCRRLEASCCSPVC